MEAARARDDDIRAYWKEAERCWLALVQNNEPQPWPFVSKETEKVRLRTQGTFSLGPSDHVTVVVQDGDIVVSVAGFCAVYYKPNNQPQLILRRRSETDDHTLLAQPRGRPTTKRASWGGSYKAHPPNPTSGTPDRGRVGR